MQGEHELATGLELSNYKELLLVLGTAAVVVPAVFRAGINPVFGFLAAGALLGPDGLGRLSEHLPVLGYITVSDRTQITYLAEAGVVFLLFMIGLELSFERLWTMRRLVFGLGAMQVLVSGAILTALVNLAGVDGEAALVIGLAFSLSSTALVVQLLADQKRLGTATGRASFAILLFQDLAVVPLLVLVGVLGGGSGGGLFENLALAAFKAAVAIGAIILLGRFVLRPLFRAVARTKSGDLFMAASLLVVIGTGMITAASGLSMALGAFIAGLILAETEFRREIEATIEPFKGLLIGVFFFSVGMSLDIAAIAADPAFIATALVVLLAVKFAIALVALRMFRIANGPAVETAMLMAPAGEFAFVILSLASGTLISSETVATGIAIAALSMLLTPVLDMAGVRLRRRISPPATRNEIAEQQLPEMDEAPDAIVAGYGRVGELVATMLEQHGLRYIALETNPDLVARARRRKRPVFYANASDAGMLERCGLAGAKVLVVTMDDRVSVSSVVRTARALRADLTIVARARDPDHASQLYAAGVSEAVPEAIEASLHISEAALIGAGVPLGLVIASIHEQRDQYRASYLRIEPDKRDSVGRLRARRTALKKKH
jgi:CPA2 family monovalent cation:H+ antiporter-2